LDVSIVNLAIPRAQEDLGISGADVQWIITAYTLTFGGLMLLGGRVADYLGRKRMLIVGLLGLAAASLLGGLAPTAGMLFAARGLQGIFAALMAPAALSLISVTFTDPKERAKAFGVFGAVSGAGAAVGLLAGGILTEYFSWRWCLAVNTPIAILAAVLAVRFVRESRATRGHSYDVPGAVTVTLGLLALVYGFTRAAPRGPTDSAHWIDPTTMIWFMLAAVLLTIFVIIELRSSSPLLPMRVILERNRGGAYLSSLFVGAGMLAMFLFLGLYMQTILGYSPVTAGFAFLPFSVGVILGAGLASNLMPRVSPRYLITPGLVAAALGMIALAQLTPNSNYFPSLFVPMIVISLGVAFVFVPIASVGLHNSGTEDAGVASAMIQTSQQIGGSIGVALMNTVAVTAAATFLTVNGAEGESAVPAALTHGYTTGFYVGAGLLITAAVIVFSLIKIGPEALKETQTEETVEG
jgi:EmrB/QacA subfamily drug resistance transporter